jgi:hypothetical protein
MTHLAIAGFNEFWARELERWFRDQSEWGQDFRNWLQTPDTRTETTSSAPAPEAPAIDDSVPSVEMVDNNEVGPQPPTCHSPKTIRTGLHQCNWWMAVPPNCSLSFCTLKPISVS